MYMPRVHFVSGGKQAPTDYQLVIGPPFFILLKGLKSLQKLIKKMISKEIPARVFERNI
jgi:hypothetical protein